MTHISREEVEAAKRLAEWFGYSWEGLRTDGRVTDKGFKPWGFDGTGQKQFQGTQNDVIDIVREIVALATRPAPADDRLMRCSICGFTVDTSYAAEKPSVEFDMRGRHKRLAPADRAAIVEATDRLDRFLRNYGMSMPSTLADELMKIGQAFRSLAGETPEPSTEE